MLKSIIRTLLQKFIDDIDSDNCNITMEQQSKIISVLSNIANPDYRMSKSLKQGYLDHPERRQKISEKLIGRKTQKKLRERKV